MYFGDSELVLSVVKLRVRCSKPMWLLGWKPDYGITVLAIHVCLYHTRAFLHLRHREFVSYTDT